MRTNELPHTVVAGLQWGDEGKGKIVDLLAEDFDVVVRYNGGANAGHTVVVGGERYAQHLMPCGVLHPGKVAVIGNGVVVDPEVLLSEIEALRARGVEIGANLRLSDRAHLVLPYHKLGDGLMEAATSTLLGGERPIGTTGRGIGPCYADKATRSTAVRVGDLLDHARLVERLRYIARLKNATLGALAQLADMPFEPLDPAVLAEACAGYAAALRPHVGDTGRYLHDCLSEGRRLLFEGANGFLLDVDHGTYPFVTSSNSSALGLYAGAGVPGRVVGDVIGVVKAYTSRVGGGPFPTEQDNPTGQRIRDRGHEYGTTTGRPRRCGWLDLVAVRYAARTCGATSLAITLLDVLAGFDTLSICVAYDLAGRRGEGLPANSDGSDVFPASSADLEAVRPIYETLPGFDEEIGACRWLADLPAAAREYLDFIARFVGLPVQLVSVGPDRAQTLLHSG